MDINLALLRCAVNKLCNGISTQEEKAKTFNKVVELVEKMKWDKNYNLNTTDIDEQ